MVTRGLVDGTPNGPDVVDREQLDLAVRAAPPDIGDYSGDGAVDKALETTRPLGPAGGLCGLDPTRSKANPRPRMRRLSVNGEIGRFVESRLQA